MVIVWHGVTWDWTWNWFDHLQSDGGDWVIYYLVHVVQSVCSSADMRGLIAYVSLQIWFQPYFTPMNLWAACFLSFVWDINSYKDNNTHVLITFFMKWPAFKSNIHSNSPHLWGRKPAQIKIQTISLQLISHVSCDSFSSGWCLSVAAWFCFSILIHSLHHIWLRYYDSARPE